MLLRVTLEAISETDPDQPNSTLIDGTRSLVMSEDVGQEIRTSVSILTERLVAAVTT